MAREKYDGQFGVQFGLQFELEIVFIRVLGLEISFGQVGTLSSGILGCPC